jgi:hypothetical protein
VFDQRVAKADATEAALRAAEAQRDAAQFAIQTAQAEVDQIDAWSRRRALPMLLSAEQRSPLTTAFSYQPLPEANVSTSRHSFGRSFHSRYSLLGPVQTPRGCRARGAGGRSESPLPLQCDQGFRKRDPSGGCKLHSISNS